MVRVAVYVVDGFNLYFGLKAKHGRKYLWLDLQALAASLLRPQQTLEQITYFTARVRNDPESQRRQSDYLDALASYSSRVTIVDGRFQEKSRRCRDCGAVWTVCEEKETDVNIAAFPPKKHSADLKRTVDGYLPLGDDKIRQAQLPIEVVNNAGITLRRPKHWT